MLTKSEIRSSWESIQTLLQIYLPGIHVWTLIAPFPIKLNESVIK